MQPRGVGQNGRIPNSSITTSSTKVGTSLRGNNPNSWWPSSVPGSDHFARHTDRSTSPMKTKIRSGRADDADFLARVMMLASRGHLSRRVWDLIDGGPEENSLDYLRRLALAEPVSLCHHSSFIVAEHDGKPAAALCGFDPRAGGWEVLADAMKKVQREKGWTQADEKASADRTAPVWKCTFDPLDGAW